MTLLKEFDKLFQKLFEIIAFELDVVGLADVAVADISGSCFVNLSAFPFPTSPGVTMRSTKIKMGSDIWSQF